MAGSPELVRLLEVNPFFGALGGEAVRAVAALCVSRRFGAGKALFFKGDPGDALYAVRRGQIRIATGTGEGRRLTLNLLGPGDVFGEVALLDGRPRTADAIAAEPAELFVIRRRDFIGLLERDPKVAVRVIELLCERIRWMSDRMEESVLLPLPARLARRLIALSEDYGTDVLVSQHELAGFVGAARESVNRQLRIWQKDGLVELGRSRIRLVDRDGLRPAADAARAAL